MAAFPAKSVYKIISQTAQFRDIEGLVSFWIENGNSILQQNWVNFQPLIQPIFKQKIQKQEKNYYELIFFVILGYSLGFFFLFQPKTRDLLTYYIFWSSI